MDRNLINNFRGAWYVSPLYPFMQSELVIFNISTYFPIYPPINTNTIHNTTNKTPCGAKLVRVLTVLGTEICHIGVDILIKHVWLLVRGGDIRTLAEISNIS